MSEMLIYQNESGEIKVDVRFEEKSIWLSQKQLSEIFSKSIKTISEHISNIFDEGELNESSVIRNFRTTANDDKRQSGGSLLNDPCYLSEEASLGVLSVAGNLWIKL